MSDVTEAKTISPPACSEKGMRDVAFRKEIRRERSKIAKRVETARVSGNVPDILRLLIAELELWTRELKMETLTLFEDTDHGRDARRMMRNPPATLSISPGYIMCPFMVVQDARDVVELVVGESQANALANRFETFDGLRRQFGEAVSDLARVWDDAPNTHLEQLVTIDRHRSDLKLAAMDLCRYVDTLANLAAARDGGNGRANASPQMPAELDGAPTTPEDRLRSLRQTFDLAVHRLDSLPDTELSPTGHPFVKECADAMLAFAAWFGEQTPDDVAIHGNPYRVQNALGGLSGVIDWVALHWSVPFAKEIDQETGELVEQADAFDQTVVKAFKVPSKHHEPRLQRKPLPDRTYADLEHRIEHISGLAYRLGSRLQRVAVWASEGHPPTARNGQQMAQGHKGEAGGSAGTMSRGLGWQFQDLPDGQTSAYHRELCEQYATLGCFDLLTLCGQWRELATGFTDHACRSGHHGAHVIHNAAVDRMTRLIETACADRKVEGVGRLSRCLRRPDDGHLHWALATLDELEAQLRAEASQRDSAKNKTSASGTDRGSDDTLTALLDDANYCLMVLGDMRRHYETMASTGRRMVGGGEDWHFDNPSDQHQHHDAASRVEEARKRLPEPLGRVIAWGASKSVEVPTEQFPFDARATSGVLADIAAEYELAIRSIMTAVTLEQATRAVGINAKSPPQPPQPAAKNRFYLYASTVTSSQITPDTVFFSCEDEQIALAIMELCRKEYGAAESSPGFYSKSASDLGLADELLLDEAIDRLAMYDDPDPGVYDPRPTKEMLLRAQYAMRARAWEKMLVERRQRGKKNDGTNVSQDNPLPTAEAALCALQRVVEKHRLMFLYFARPERRNPANQSNPLETVYRDQLPGGRIPTDAIDGAGEFLFKYRWLLDQFAQTAVGQFGPGIGAKPTVYRDGAFVQVEGGSLPVWSLDDVACIHLEQSADAILDACKVMAKLGAVKRYQALIKRVRHIIHDEGQSKWYSSVLVQWEYLSRLDELITDIKAAELDFEANASIGDSRESVALPSPNSAEIKDRPSHEKASQTTSPESKQDSQPIEKTASECLKSLASSLQELRAAAEGVLAVPEPAGSYPKPQIDAYQQAMQRATIGVDRLGDHFDAHGEIETRIRDCVGELSNTMERVISKCNSGSGSHEIDESIAAPAREATKVLMALEWTVAMMTATPDQLEMPAEDRRISGLTLLMLLAQGYYKMLESAISMASWCSALDLELNQSYLWVTTSLTNLLKNHEDLTDFPVKFEPMFPDLYPSTIRDVDWQDLVAPDAEGFLSTVQKYVHAKGMYEPAKGSSAWTFVELFRPGVDAAIERAIAYNKRMRQYAQKAFGGISAGENIEAGGTISAAGSIRAGGGITAGGDVRASAVPPVASPKDTDGMWKGEEREPAIQSLLQPLVRIDANFLNFGVHMKRLREENLHEVFSGPRPTNLTVAQIREIQDRLMTATKPIQDAVAEAKEKCDGIAQHLSGVIDNPAVWETTLRTNLRLFGEALCGFRLTVPSSADEEVMLNGLMVAICEQGTQLQDAYQTIAATHPKGAESGDRIASSDGISVGFPDTGADARSTAPTAQQAAFNGQFNDQIKRLNDMERNCIQSLYEKGIVGANVNNRPTQETLSRWAGYQCDTNFKTALSAVVKAGYLDNGRHHGKRGGYFLTPKGECAGQLIISNQS